MARSRSATPQLSRVGLQFIQPGRTGMLRYLTSHRADPALVAQVAANFDAQDLQRQQLHANTAQQAAQLAQQNTTRDQANALQQQQMQQQFAIQQSQLAQQNDQFNSRQRLDAQRAQADAALRRQSLGLQAEQSRQRHGLDQERMVLSQLQESKRMGDQERMDAQWQMSAAQDADRSMAELMKQARGIDYTPEGRRIYAKLAAEGRAIQAAKGNLRPAQFAEMAGQWLQNFSDADLGSYQAEPPKIDDALSRGFKDIGNGMGAILKPDGSIQIVKTTDGSAMASLSELTQGEVEPPAIRTPEQRAQEMWMDPKKSGDYIKAYQAAEKEMRNEWLSDPANADNLDAPKIEPADILERMMAPLRAQYELEHRIAGKLTPAEQAEQQRQNEAFLKEARNRPTIAQERAERQAAAKAEQQRQNEAFLAEARNRPTIGQERAARQSARTGQTAVPPEPILAHDPVRAEATNEADQIAQSLLQQPTPERPQRQTPPVEPAGADPQATLPAPVEQTEQQRQNEAFLQEARNRPTIREEREARQREREAAESKGLQSQFGRQSDDDYFAGNEFASQLKGVFDQVLSAGDKAKQTPGAQAVKDLAAALKKSGRSGHPARFIDQRAINRLHSIGDQDPIGTAAKSITEAIDNGWEHFSLKDPITQEALANTLQVFDPERDQAAIEALPPGTYYMDPALRIYRTQPGPTSHSGIDWGASMAHPF